MKTEKTRERREKYVCVCVRLMRFARCHAGALAKLILKKKKKKNPTVSQTKNEIKCFLSHKLRFWTSDFLSLTPHLGFRGRVFLFQCLMDF